MKRLLAKFGWFLVDWCDPVDLGPDPWEPAKRWMRRAARSPQGFYVLEDPATKEVYRIPTYVPEVLKGLKDQNG